MGRMMDEIRRYREVHETATASDTVRMAAVESDMLDWIHPYWDQLPDSIKIDRVREIADIHGETRHSSNTTCIELDEYRVANLSQATNDNQFITELAVGSDGQTPEYTNRSLNNEIDRSEITEFVEDPPTLTSNVFLSKGEGNGPTGSTTLQELGLYAGTYFLNHSLFTAIEKTDQKAVVIEVDLTFSAA